MPAAYLLWVRHHKSARLRMTSGRHLNSFGKKICDFLPLVGDNLRNIDRRCLPQKRTWLIEGDTSEKCQQAPVRNVRTLPAMPREKVQAAPTARPKVPMRRRGADCLVVATKVL
jgi:hypothetical protein